MEALFSPQSIAVVGASRKEEKPGYRILKNLIDGGYSGDIIPVNPRAKTICGHDCYPSLSEYGKGVELVIVAPTVRQIKAVVDDCARVKAKAMIVMGGDFSKTADGGEVGAQEIANLCRRHDIRLLGHESLGFINTKKSLNASLIEKQPTRGGVCLFSQSASLCRVMLGIAVESHMGLSKLISIGTKADISGSELLSYLADDKDSSVIGGYLEDIVSGKDFIKAAERAATQKPVVIMKSGTTDSGRSATLSHTGVQASADTAFGAAFSSSGVTRADSLEALLDSCLAFSLQQPPQGKGVRIISDSVGPGILAADAVENAGMEVTGNPVRQQSSEPAHSPLQYPPDNPVVVLGEKDTDAYIAAILAAQNDSSVATILLVLTPCATKNCADLFQAIGNCTADSSKTTLCVLMGESSSSRLHMELTEVGLPSFPTPERAIVALRGMHQYGEWKHRPIRTVTRFRVNRRRVERILYRRQRTGRLQIGEVKGKDILGAYGFRVPKGALASSAEEAVEIAERITYPVAMKIVSPDIVHKSDLGGVSLNVSDAGAVEDSYDLMSLKIRRRIPEAFIEGVYVEQMAAKGLEVIIGMSRDPLFGPMLMFGLGGIFVEVMKDVTFHLAPITEQEAIQMLQSTKSYAMLQGRRGANGVDVAAIARGLQRISQLTTDFPQIVELDINPFIVGNFGSEPVVADVRMTLAALPDAQ